MISINDAKEIASRGGGMILDASKFLASDLKEIASRSSDGGNITLRNANTLLANDAKEIASRGNGHVVLDYT